MADGARESQNVVPTVTGQAALAEAGKLVLPEAGKLSVFISYSRDDLAFADQLDAALGLQNYATTLDRHGIGAGEKWELRLGGLIRDADTVVFVLSPSSARSKVCAWEVAEAVKLGKRILPVLNRPLEDATPPPELASLNYIHFYDEPRSPNSGFGTGLVKLVGALDTDLGWLREHTRLMQRASEWAAGGRDENRLLFGSSLADAKTWAAHRPKGAPEPTSLHLEFIRSSEEAAVRRQSAERQQLAAMASAAEQRQKALAEAEAAQIREVAAQKREAEASKLAVKRTRQGLIAALLLALVATMFGAFAWRQTLDANDQKQQALMEKLNAFQQAQTARLEADKAKKAEAKTDATRRDALLGQSQFLAVRAGEVTKQNPTLGLLLALEALPDASSTGVWEKNRPYWAPAEVELEGSRLAMREMKVLAGHEGRVTSVAVSKDGKRIVTGSSDKTVRIWDFATGAELKTLQGHTETVTSVAISPDGTLIVSGSDDHSARIWDANSGALLHVLKGHDTVISAVAIFPDGGRIITGSGDGTARIWDAATGAQFGQLQSLHKSITCLAAMPDGTHVVVGGRDNSVWIWDATSGVEVRSWPLGDGTVESVAVSPDGSAIVTGSSAGSVRLWNAAHGTEIEGTGFGFNQDAALSLAFSPDGQRVFAGGQNGNVMIAERSSKFRNRPLVGSLVVPSHDGAVASLAASPGGDYIVTGGEDNTVRIWDVRLDINSRVLSHDNQVNAVAITPDGFRVVTGSGDDVGRIWDAATGALLRELKGHDGSIHGIAVSADGTKIVTGSGDGTARIWNAVTGAQLRVLKLPVDPDDSKTVSVSSIAISPNGSRIVTSSDNGLAIIWDVASGTRLRKLERRDKKGKISDITSVAISPDGTQIVTGSDERNVRLWDAESGAMLRKLNGHKKAVKGVAFSRSGAEIGTISKDGSVRIWDAATGSELRVLEIQDKGGAHNNRAVAFLPDGSGIVAGNRVFDIATGAEIAVFKTDDGDDSDIVTSVAVSTDGKRIAMGYRGAGPRGPTVNIWETPFFGPPLVSNARATAPRCLTPAERQRFFLPPAPPVWCAGLSKWPYDPKGALVEGARLLEAGKDDEAKVIFAARLEHDPTIAPRIGHVWAKAFIERGDKLLGDDKDIEATAQFNLALAQDATVARSVAKTWARAHIDRAQGLLSTFQRYEAKDALDQSLAWSGREGLDADVLKQHWSMSSQLGERFQDRDEEALGLITIWAAQLDLSPEVRRQIGLAALSANTSLTDSIARVHASLMEPDWPEPNVCDLEAGDPADPMRMANGVLLDRINMHFAITACDVFSRDHPDEPRFLYERARAHRRLATWTASIGNKELSKTSASAAIVDLEAAMAKGYPMAYRAMADAIAQGDGLPKDIDKAAGLYVHALNRVIACCWVGVARELLANEGEFDAGAVRRLVRELTVWAAALGSQPARDLLAELVAKGIIAPEASPLPATFTDVPPWLRD